VFHGKNLNIQKYVKNSKILRAPQQMCFTAKILIYKNTSKIQKLCN